MLADESACDPTGVSTRDERKLCTGDEIDVSTVKGIHLGGVGIRGSDVRTSLELAMSLVSLMAGAGVTRSALSSDGRDAGSPRGVVVVKALPSWDFTAEGEGVKEFNSPLTSERGGTEMTSSFSLMIG